eukprot:Skav227647  [mRNA]  locus=scaffold58:286081:290157:+ [translate_table: standard]
MRCICLVLHLWAQSYVAQSIARRIKVDASEERKRYVAHRGTMMQIASPKSEEVDGARGTRLMSDAESLLQKKVSAAQQRDQWNYAVIMLAFFGGLLVWGVYLHFRDRLTEDIHASPYMAFQDKELQCHEGCRQHDMANSDCLQACLPDKLACVSSECADMGPESPEYSSCVPCLQSGILSPWG